MATAEQATEPLVAGDRLTREEFLRRWEAMPNLKRAELIGGVVYIPSALRRVHAVMENDLSGWLAVYRAFTPGCEAGNNATWKMLRDSPQPDIDLRILPECGGQSGMDGPFAKGAPELLAELHSLGHQRH